MRIEQSRWTEKTGWSPQPNGVLDGKADLAMVFGGSNIVKNQTLVDEIRKFYPTAHIMGCSTAGEIFGTSVSDDSLVVTAVKFRKSHISGAKLQITSPEDSYRIGKELSQKLNQQNLVHVFVLSDGLNVNGSDLVKGLTDQLPKNVSVTGGLSGDGARFKETFVMWDDQFLQNTVAVLGLYGSNLKIGYGSLGGWDPFGPDRIITKSKGNVLYELDGQSALDLYKKYLGDHAQGLPATGLLFPLRVVHIDAPEGVVRTILSVNETEKSMTFAGDVPEGATARLMKANFDRLIDGATSAAETSYEAIGSQNVDLSILISCVGRKLILKQRVEEEVEAVREVQGEHAVLTGFYSYGEIAPFMPNAKCELHNQTMTITTISERD